MKTCRVCGAFVEDKAFTCPECGAEMVQSSGKLSLKTETDTKKKSSGNQMGQTVSTGSGLTDILRAGAADEGVDDDAIDEFYGGSIPTALTKTTIDEDYSSKKRKHKIVSKIFKLALLAAAAFGVYFFVMNVVLKEKEKGAQTYGEAIEIFIDGINDNDPDSMTKIIPPYEREKIDNAQFYIADFEGAKITEYREKRVVDGKEQDPDAISPNVLMSEIKLGLNKAISISETKTVTVAMRLDVDGRMRQIEVDFILFKAEGAWYLYRLQW